MIISEKYQKSKIEDKIYDTVILADIIELNNEKYFIISGYLFNNQKTEQTNHIEEEYKNDTFFKIDINDEESDIDAYYLIYNIDKDEFIKQKKQFIEQCQLFKNIRLDKTKLKNIEIGGQLAYLVNTNKKEYFFIETNDEISQYLILQNTKHGLYPKHIIEFNSEYNNVKIDNNIIEIKEMYNKFEQNNISQLVKNISRIIRKKAFENNKEEENE